MDVYRVVFSGLDSVGSAKASLRRSLLVSLRYFAAATRPLSIASIAVPIRYIIVLLLATQLIFRFLSADIARSLKEAVEVVKKPTRKVNLKSNLPIYS